MSGMQPPSAYTVGRRKKPAEDKYYHFGHDDAEDKVWAKMLDKRKSWKQGKTKTALKNVSSRKNFGRKKPKIQLPQSHQWMKPK